MKSSIKKLRGFGLNKNDPKAKREDRTPAHHDELNQASEVMVEMRDCYDNLLSAAAATANSAYEFSEALREMGTCLLQKTALNEDEESGRVMLMLGKVQFELQKLVDNYRVHIIQTITTPSESLLKELGTVEEMERQCKEKRDQYNSMLASQREKGKSRNNRGETISSHQLQAYKEDFEEEANLFVFRLKSLKQGQSHSLLTQSARHHAAQLNFFRKGVQSLELVEPHVRAVAEQQHIDYQFSGLEDDCTEDYDDNSYDENNVGELSFDYGQNELGQEVISMELDQVDGIYPPSSAEISQENLIKSHTYSASSNRGARASSYSAPIFADRSETTEKIIPNVPSLSKSNTYALPTPADAKRSPSPPNLNKKYAQGASPAKVPKPQSILKESNINTGPIKLPPPLSEGLSLSDNKKIKIYAYSGPLTSQPWSTKLNKKISPNASPPPIPSPRISELHELPRPPIASAKPASLFGHSAPLVSRGQDFNAFNKRTSISSLKASPLPTPPTAMARSYSIPSSGQRTPRLNTVNSVNESPPLTPIYLASNQLVSDSAVRSTPKDLS